MDACKVVENLLKQPAFGDLVAQIDALVSASVSDYLKDLAAQGGRSTAKAVKDAVWGMIDLTDREIVVLDSPVLQRLHHIRQLGVTYLTYPTAGYSRYEHTLGAMHQAERMLRAIAARSPSQESELLSEKDTVRLAAMLHDIGHLPFSHVSERYYTEKECTNSEHLREIETIKNEIADTLPARIPPLSECLSLALALTPSLRRLLGTGVAKYSEEQVAEAILSIVGRPPSLKRAYLAQLITNVIDADKLDYMFRDAYYTGVPLGVDLERLIYKLRCLTVSKDQCPDAMKDMFSQAGDVRVLGTDLAGQWHAYDLAASRAMLFERVYHHHKTLAAERVVLRALRNLDLPPARLLVEDDRFFSNYAENKHPKTNISYLRRLDLRNLPRRAFAMSYGFLQPTESPEGGGMPDVSEQDKEAWDGLERTIKDATHRLSLEEEIQVLACALAKAAKTEIGSPEVWVDTPPEPARLPDVDLLIERPDGTIAQQVSFPAEAAGFAQSPFGLSFVYVTKTGQEGRHFVFLATEKLLAEKYQLVLGRAAADHAKINWKTIDEHKRALEKGDPSFFKKCRALRPKSQLARTLKSQSRVDALSLKFAHFNNAVLNSDRICRFLDQFPEALVEPVLTVLENISFLDRSELGRRSSEVVLSEATADEVCVPLSKWLHKSSAHLAYYLHDNSEGPKLIPIQEALNKQGNITFLDDCLLSGSQARTVIQTWFGRPKDLDEDLADELSQAQRESLLAKQVRFRFLFATDGGIANLRQLTDELGLGEDVAASKVVSDVSKPLDSVLSGDALSRLRNFLQDIGFELLTSTKGKDNPTKWTEQQCKKYALGYGGLEQLLVIMYNTPTASLTALWKAGTIGGIPWLPLFPRRGETSPSDSVGN